MTMNITNGDCLELMKNLPDKSIDLFICDLPYGETNCKWDSVIDLEEFWIQFKRLRKSKRTACIHFCSTKFGYTIIKSNEKMFKMDMVWKKRNKTGGLQSRNRPMRNHEMVYFFYEQAPKYNRDKYHKRIQAKNPIVKEEGAIFGKGYEKGKEPPFCKSIYFEPPNPLSVIEEKLENDWGFQNATKTMKTFKNKQAEFAPKLPVSVLEEEKDEKPKKNKTIKAKDRKSMGEQSGIYAKENQISSNFEPPNPASVVEESKTDVWGKTKFSCGGDCGLLNEDGSYKGKYEPPNPASVYESTKVFIGKRNHQTEKPQDILEFFIKYWSDEGHTILDPTMGSGSTGVACKKLKRNFIGFEKDDKIFNVAKNRIDKII